jgi:predicted CXXCH cytochrome family protein
MKKTKIFLMVSVLGSLLFIGDSPKDSVSFLYPTLQDSTSYEQGQIFIISAAKDSNSTLLVSTQWQELKYVDFFNDTVKENFAKEFYKYFVPRTTIQEIWYSFKYLTYFTPPESLTFKYTDTMSIREFWKRPEFAELYGAVKNTKADYLLIRLKGWKDTTYTTAFDDPNADNRALYKIPLRLITGLNTIYFAVGGEKNHAIEFTTTLANDFKSLDSRNRHFHNSELEKGCITCHEGLPSADSGATMKADCTVCHKAFALGPMMHSPVEMKECGSCHSWSAEKKSVVVAKGVPETCFECHTEKKITLDSAKVPHPVAGDCLTCHSPHSSRENHLLKKSVFELCTGCHTEYTINHPVGKHPLRFKKVKANDREEEISCVSCHQPHGSDNEHLLNVGGGTMAVCVNCHQK